MKLEQQVVSLELAKKMKELGFEQESYLYWVNVKSMQPQSDVNFWGIWRGMKDEILGVDVSKNISAYTVAELGEMLPAEVWLLNEPPFKKQYLLTINRYTKSNDWSVSYVRKDDQDFIDERAKTEADARAKMLIYLKENNLI